MGGKSSTTTSTSGPPQQFLDAYTNTYNQAAGLSQQPYQAYTGPMVAGFSPDQLAAFGTVQGSQGLAQPYYNQAAAYMMNAATPVSPQGFDIYGGDYSQFLPGVGLDYMTYAGKMAEQANAPINLMNYNIDPYQNQYTNDVTDALSNTFAQNNAQQYNQIRGNAGTQNAFGTDREAIAEAQTAQQQDLAQQQTLAGVKQQGFAQAQQEFNAQQALDYQRQVAEKQSALQSGQLGLGIGQGMWGEFNTQQQQDLAAQEASAYLQAQAGTQLANLGTTAQGSALSGAQAQMGIGSMEQQLAQQELNVPYYQFMQQQAYPYQQTGWLANISEGLGGASGGTGSTTYPGPSTLGQVAGLGTAGLGAYGMFSGSGNSGYGGGFTNSGANGWYDTGNYDALANWAADGGAIKRAPGGAVGLGVPPEFGGAGVPGMDGALQSYIPGASGMGDKPSSSGGGLSKMFMQPVTSQTQSGGGGGLGSILGLGLSAAKLFLDNGGSVGLANGGPTTHSAAPIVSDLSHVMAPNFLPKPDAEVIMPQRNFAPSFDAQGYPGTMQAVPRGAPVPAPLSIPMSNGMFNRAALGAPPPAPPPTPNGLITETMPFPTFDPTSNFGSGGGGAAGGHVGLGGIHFAEGGSLSPASGRTAGDNIWQIMRELRGDPGKPSFPDAVAASDRIRQELRARVSPGFAEGGLAYPDMSKGYIPTLQAPTRTMGPPAPPTNPAWKPDQGLSSSSVIDVLKGVKSSGLLNKTAEESMGGAVMPSAVPLQYDAGGVIPGTMAAQQQNAAIQKYQAVPLDKLRQLAMTHPATSPDGAAIQRALQMKQVAGAYPGGTGPTGPYGPQGGAMPGTTAANGGRMGLAAGGNPEMDEDYGSPAWFYSHPAPSRGIGVSPETLNILSDHALEGMTPVERSIKFAPSYGEGQVIPGGMTDINQYSDFNSELRANEASRAGMGREDDLLRALGRVQGYEEPTYPRINGMNDMVNWPQGSMARGGLARGYDTGGDVVAEADIPSAVYYVDEPGLAATSPPVEPLAEVPSYKDKLSRSPDAPADEWLRQNAPFRTIPPPRNNLNAPSGPNWVNSGPEDLTKPDSHGHDSYGPGSPIGDAPKAPEDILYGRVRNAENTAGANDGFVTYGSTPFTPGADHPRELARREGRDHNGNPVVTHAAGPGQWQPDTWDGLKPAFAEKFGRDPVFSSHDDQKQMVWLNAAKIYPGGEDKMRADIAAGTLNTRALAPQWEGFYANDGSTPPGGGRTLASGISPGYSATVPRGDVAVRPLSGEAEPAGAALAARPSDDVTSRMDALLRRLDERRGSGNDMYKSPWLPVLTAGLGMMASRSPFPGVAIGEGGLQGVKAMMQQAEAVPKNELEQTKSDAARFQMDLQGEKMREAARSLGASSGAGGSSVPVPAVGAATAIPAVGGGADTVIPSGGHTSATPAASTAATPASSTTPSAPILSPASGMPLPANFGKAPAGSAEAVYDNQYAALDQQIADVRRANIWEPEKLAEHQATLAKLLETRINAMTQDPRMVGARKWAEVDPAVEQKRRETLATLPAELAKSLLSQAGRPQTVHPGEVVTTGAGAMGIDMPALLNSLGLNGPAIRPGPAASAGAPSSGPDMSASTVPTPTPAAPFRAPGNLAPDPSLTAPQVRLAPAPGGGVTAAPTIPGLPEYQKKSGELASEAQKGLSHLTEAAPMLEAQHQEIVSSARAGNLYTTGFGADTRRSMGNIVNTAAGILGVPAFKEDDLASLAAIDKATFSLASTAVHGISARPALLEFQAAKTAVPSIDQPAFSALLLSNTLRLQNSYQQGQAVYVLDQYKKGVDPALAAQQFQNTNGNMVAGSALASTYLDMAKARPEAATSRYINVLLSAPPELREQRIREFNEKFTPLGPRQSAAFGVKDWGSLILQLAGK